MSNLPKLALIAPGAVAPNKLLSVIPANSDGVFNVNRNTPCDTIDKEGNSVEVAAHTARLDYRDNHVEPLDESYYEFDGIDDFISINGSHHYKTFSVLLKGFTPLTINNNDRIITKGVTSNGAWMISFTSNNYIRVFTKDSDGISLDYIFSDTPLVSGTKYNITVEFDYSAGVVTVEYNGVNSQTSTSVAWTGVFNFLSNIRIATNSSESQFTRMNIEKVYIFNKLLSSQEKIDIYNGLSIPSKYVGANNIDYTAGNFTIGKQYKIVTIGTTDFTLIGASSNSIGIEFKATGIGIGSGTATSIGNTLDLSVGKSNDFWYDRNHDVIGTVIGAILVDGTNFGNNFHGIKKNPSVKVEPSFTTFFKNSRTPVTQTITGLTVGETYTVNCKGPGIINIAETGGVGKGGHATEVYHFTYVATQTSVVVTLLDGHYFEFVQMTDTDEPKNHVNTLTTSVTKEADVITITPPNGVVSITETIDDVEQPPITTIPGIYQMPNGNINKVIMK